MKRRCICIRGLVCQVAPRRGAWIETSECGEELHDTMCRTPQGCVD